ncbi:hypothetical protein AAMO2058_001489400 [Amorphochlora amoebiformis]
MAGFLGGSAIHGIKRSLAEEGKRDPDLALKVAKGYHKTLQDDSFYARLCQSLTIGTLGFVAHTFMHVLNETKIENSKVLQDAAYKRRPEYKDRGLITVSNHVSAFDDPLIPAAMWSIPRMFSPYELRYVFCSIDRCFKKYWLGRMLTSVKVIPVERGGGLDQSRDEGKTLKKLKVGVAALVVSADVPPPVIPFYHHGMHNVLPVGAQSLKTGNKIRIVVGEPIFFDDLIRLHRQKGYSEKEVYSAITARIEVALRELHESTHRQLDRD